MAFIFVVEGWLKITHYPAIVDYMQSYGVSGRLLPFVIMTEFGGGLLVAVGLFQFLQEHRNRGRLPPSRRLWPRGLVGGRDVAPRCGSAPLNPEGAGTAHRPVDRNQRQRVSFSPVLQGASQ
jgi:hypothetical protein